MKKVILSVLCFLLPLGALLAQNGEDEYTKVLRQRAGKIVETLGLTDPAVKERVSEIMVGQYKSLGKIHDAYDEEIAQLKKSEETKEAKEQKKQELTDQRDLALFRLHNSYIGLLLSELSLEQVDQVKDGMTFGVVKVTYDSYCDMIPSLKDDEKRQLYAWLVEAREYAMDAASSKKKHEWFGKYKGRYNNYLSKQGYNLQEERAAWQKRLEAKKTK